MSETTTRPGTRIMDRPEFRSKPQPLAMSAQTSCAEAAARMAEKNFGSVVIIDEDRKVLGVVTERDFLKRLVNEGRDAKTTRLGEIMTENPKVARADDDMLDWLRQMSNERFRRLPVVDEDGRLVTVMTQGDFVSYTWPDLIHQAAALGRATLTRNLPPYLILAALVIYPLIVAVAFGLLG